MPRYEIVSERRVQVDAENQAQATVIANMALLDQLPDHYKDNLVSPPMAVRFHIKEI